MADQQIEMRKSPRQRQVLSRNQGIRLTDTHGDNLPPGFVAEPVNIRFIPVQNHRDPGSDISDKHGLGLVVSLKRTVVRYMVRCNIQKSDRVIFNAINPVLRFRDGRDLHGNNLNTSPVMIS